MADEALIAEILNEVVDDVLQNGLVADPSWESYGLAAEVMDDGSTIQAAYLYSGDDPPRSASGVRQSFSLVELREASRGDDGETWDVFVMKIHRPSGQAATKFVSGAETAEWSLLPDNDARLAESLRARQEDFDKPIT
jgi:hypothetical protein